MRHDQAADEAPEGSKEALDIEMLRRPEGATLDQIAYATGWLEDTIRGASPAH